MEESAKIFHFISHTHWDREWYRSFEEFRMILVSLIDELLDLLENDPEYKYFHLDGQTIVLEDYLEIRPQNTQRLSKLIKQRKLFIGPWYVLPDEFLVSGEALIRNLLRGHKIGERFGGVMKVGYIPDSFGHISQLPQILEGFGIDNVILWRGFGGESEQQFSEYIWRGPDSTEVLMIHLPPGGYGWDFIATTAQDEIIEKGKKLYQKLVPRALTNHLLCLQGSDHFWPYRKLPAILSILSEHFGDRFIHSNLEDYITAVKNSKANFPIIEGEHRSGYNYSFLLQGVYSSRMYLKQMNETCQTSLERYAEPLNVIQKLSGKPSQLPFLKLAWKYLLQNHPHDSICGCGIDAIHREMMTRFEKCLQIANRIISDSLSQLTSPNSRSEEKIFLYLFNASPYLRTELVECQLDLPIQSDQLLSNNNFKILDSNNHEIPFQILNYKKDYQLKYRKYDHVQQNLVQRFSLLIDVKNLPSLGLKRFKLIPQGKQSIYNNRVKIGRFYLENKFLRVEISPNGVIKLINKSNKQIYNNLNIFEDSADVGDEYNYSFPPHDEIFLSKQFKPRLSVVENGPLRGAIRIRTRMKVPLQASEDKQSRATQKTVLKLSSIVYLEYNSPVLYFVTTVLNNVKDHRLRVLFQTNVRTAESYAESAFHIIKRKHKKYNSSAYQLEIPSATHPMQRFITIVDKEKGFTLFSKGLPEYELKLDGQGTIALTLLRCMGKLSESNLITRPGGDAGPKKETPEAQCQGNFTFKYAILPHGPDIKNEVENIYNFAEWYNLKPRYIQRRGNADLFPENSLLKIEPQILRLAAFKETEKGDGFLLRIYNASEKNVTGSIQFNFSVTKVYLSNLNEIEIKELEMSKNHKLKIVIKAWGIFSCKILATT